MGMPSRSPTSPPASIGRALRDREGGETTKSEPPQDRHDGALSAVATPRTPAARVDEERRAIRSLNENRFSLAHVEDDDAGESVRPGGREGDAARTHGERGNPERGRPATDPREEEQGEPGRGCRRGRGWAHVHDGAREGREGADDEAQRDEQNPEALEEQVGKRLAHGGYPQGQDAAGREEAGQRHHEEVRDHPEGGKLAEVEEHHGSHPQLGTERYGQGGGDRAGAPRDEPRADPRTEMEQAGRRRERELETGLHQAARVQGQEHQERGAARLFQARLSRPRSPAARNSPPMTVARSTDGCPPTTAANATRVASARPAARGAGTRRSLSSRNADPATRATLKPEIARTWNTPARRKSASKVGGSWRRSPMRRPSRSEPETAGRCASMTPWIHSRVRSHQGTATGGGAPPPPSARSRSSAGFAARSCSARPRDCERARVCAPRP